MDTHTLDHAILDAMLWMTATQSMRYQPVLHAMDCGWLAGHATVVLVEEVCI